MTWPKHPLLRALLLAGGALFLLGTLVVALTVGLVVCVAVLLGASVFGGGLGKPGRRAFPFVRPVDLFSGAFGRAAPRPRGTAARNGGGNVIEGEAREVSRGP